MDFPSVYQRYGRDVFRFALYLSGNYAQAEDIAAETFARAWVARDRIQVGTVKAYLLMIARNVYRDQIRTTTAGERQTDTLPEVEDAAPGPEAAARERQRLNRTLAALRGLPERDRAALTMAAVEGLAYDQIAAVLGISVGLVKVRIHRARLKLNRLLEAKEEP